MSLTNKDYIMILSFLILVTLMIIINKIGTDFAWLSYNIDYYIKNGELKNVIFNTPSGWWAFFTYLSAQIINIIGEFSYLTAQFLNIIFSMLGIVFLYRLIFAITNDSYKTFFVISIYLLLGYGTGILSGTRPENIYISSMIMVVYSIYKHYHTNDYKYLYFGVLFAIFGALSHPNGLVNFIILLIYGSLLVINSKINYKHLFILIFTVLVLFPMLLLFGQSYEQFISSFLVIATDKGHTMPFYYEWLRYKNFIQYYNYLFIILFLGMFVMFNELIKNIKTDNTFVKTVNYSLIFIMLYLLFIGQKLEYYLSLYFPFIAIYLSIYKIEKISVKYYAIITIVAIFTTILIKLPENEEFLKKIHLPSGRVGIIENIKNETKGKIVLAPIQTFFIFRKNSYFIPSQQFFHLNIEQNFDYFVIQILLDKEKYEKKYNIKLTYKRSFVYNKTQFNLFKVVR